MAKISKNFTSQEFACPHCGKVNISPILVNKLQGLRDKVGEPIFITSGYRCKTYNQKIGGYSKSPHLDGLAADCHCKVGILPMTLARMASSIKGIRLGIYPLHLHIDVVPPNPSKYWLVKAYNQKPIYSGSENNLAKFLKDNL